MIDDSYERRIVISDAGQVREFELMKPRDLTLSYVNAGYLANIVNRLEEKVKVWEETD